ncbi:DUF6064 family protein [Ramlibacter albus]|uniref:MFS transporter permease n=1 Tax=Ramlibacter albus TaxID=2079448 RepID=A0A923MB39_9BURK|nr:DUF6064 family protein [Ramlibacter albus]MBC5766104.1 hypothetical protein [Ramlibacter albus]
MTEWWTYRLHSFLMFSPRTYWRTVENYNAETWPAHAIAVLGAVSVMLLTHRRQAPRVLALLLAVAWLWVAWAFLWQRYSPIFLGGPWLAAAFAMQGIALLYVAIFGPRPAEEGMVMRSSLATVLVYFGLMVVPVATALVTPARVHLFGTMPDPTALTTLGVIVAGALPASRRARRWLAVVPVLALLAGGLTWWALLE